jgi:muconate cycloisomerase
MSAMQIIERIELFPLSIPFLRSFDTSGGRNRVKRVIAVRMSGGSEQGVGEVATAPEAGSETIRQSLLFLRKRLVPRLLGASVDGTVADRIIEDSAQGFSFSKAGIKNALLDLRARIHGVPVWRLLGVELYRRRVPVGNAVGIKPAEQALEEALILVERGFTSIKIKIGGDPHMDLERIDAMASGLNGRATFRLDANQGYSFKDWPIIKSMEREEVDWFEEPFAARRFSAYKLLKRRLNSAVFLDESIQSPADVYWAAGCADGVNLKVSLLGGADGVVQAGLLALSLGLRVTVGGFIETSLGTVPGVHAACVLPEIGGAAGLVGPTLLEADPGLPGVTIRRGKTHLPEGVGMGIDLNLDVVSTYGAKL